MAALFKATPSPEKTIVVVDIENGSVGAALVRLSPKGSPKLFGQIRNRIPFFHAHDAYKLSQEIERAAHNALLHAQEVAARIRMHKAVAPIGAISQGMVFLHGPWSGVQFGEEGGTDITAVESFLTKMRSIHGSISGDLPVSFHSFGASISPLLSKLYDAPEDSLVCSMSGEITELFMVSGNRISGYGSMPFGTNTLLRTLRTHAGLSEAESYSALRLASHHAQEAFDAAGEQLAQEFVDITRELFASTYVPTVFVIAQEPFAHWVANALTHTQVSEVFSEGGTVRAVRAGHIAPFVSAHAGTHDVPLMLGSLFADARYSAI